MNPIYLDYNATTPIDPAVLEAMRPYLGATADCPLGHFGNPSSAHAYGQRAHQAVEQARAQVAELLGAQPDEIVFTGGGSEASNLAIKGVVFLAQRSLVARLFGRSRTAHVVTTTIEHPATLQPCAFLERLGCRVTQVPVDSQGVVDLNRLEKAVKTRPTLVTVMHSNNEVGTLQPIREIAALCKRHGVLLHTDAAQSLGKLPVRVDDLGVDLLTVAGHKLYAPKGVGVLYVRRGVSLEPLIHGAGHEGGRRAGTENVPYLVGLGEACRLARDSLPGAAERLRVRRDRLWQRLREGLGERVVLNGHPEQRLPNTLNVSFLGQVGADFLKQVPEIAASTGSACHEGQMHLSPVLCAMRVPQKISQGAVRLSVGRFTTEEEIERAAEVLIRAAKTS